MSLGNATHQKPEASGPTSPRSGESTRLGVDEEAGLGRHEPKAGMPLLDRALRTENLVKAWKRVKANKGSAGVDGKSIADTAQHLRGHSYGFRPARRAHDAIRRAQGYIQAGNCIVVDVDLENFFDRVHHDVLMDRLERRISDPAGLKLIRRYLQAGVMMNWVVQRRHEGTPRGGPLSPLLANVLLD